MTTARGPRLRTGVAMCGLLLALCGWVLPSHAAASGKPKQPKVMVLELTHDESLKPATMSALNAFLAGAIRDEGFDVMTPAQIGAVLGLERQRQLLGCSESNCLAEIGGALGVDFIVQGSLAVLSKQVALSLTVVDKKGAALASQRRLVKGTDADALFPAVQDLVPKLMQPARPHPLELGPTAQAEKAQPAGALTGHEVEQSPTVGHATGSYVLLTAGAVLLAGSIVTGVMAKSSESAYRSDIRKADPGSLGRDKDAANRFALISTVATGAGAVVGGSGAIWWLASSPEGGVQP